MKERVNAAEMEAMRCALRSWYRENHRELPWRKTKDPYRIWVSEVMLQQTQVVTVIPYYRRFIRIFPNVKTLASAELQEVLKVWEGLGYYTRARNLHGAAREVMTEYHGRIPSDPKTLLSLPGIGTYMAAAIASIAFGSPQAVVDGNVKRVLSRLFMVNTPVNSSPSVSVFQKYATRLLDTLHPGDFNQALMELGAMICRPQHPECGLCPLKPSCRAFRHGRVQAYPKRSRRPRIPTYAVAVGVVFRKNRVLILQRKESGFLGGLWEFPGGKLQPGETPEAACIREIREETALSAAVERSLTRIRHSYTHFKIVADIFRCRYLGGRVHRSSAVAHRWVRIQELDRFPFPGANRKFMPLLKTPPD